MLRLEFPITGWTYWNTGIDYYVPAENAVNKIPHRAKSDPTRCRCRFLKRR